MPRSYRISLENDRNFNVIGIFLPYDEVDDISRTNVYLKLISLHKPSINFPRYETFMSEKDKFFSCALGMKGNPITGSAQIIFLLAEQGIVIGARDISFTFFDMEKSNLEEYVTEFLYSIGVSERLIRSDFGDRL